MNELYISKSFCCVGRNTQACFGCAFCRISQAQQPFEYATIPSEINPNFVHLPVAVNLFYGDPLIQQRETLSYLERLERAGHKAPVLIITKGDLRAFDLPKFDLDIHLAFSTFGIKHQYNPYSHERMQRNMEVFAQRNYQYKKSIEFRPVCYGINDTPEIIRGVFAVAKEHGAAIGYSGLQGIPEVVKHWEANGIDLKPYPNFKFGHKKSISPEVQAIFEAASDEFNVPIFRKTSCLISYVHGMERDYNAHYYRPNEMNCAKCAMRDKCFGFKAAQTLDVEPVKQLIPFDFRIEEKVHHTCILKKKGICEFPSEDCDHIQGKIIVIDEKMTTADVRVTKWLTGFTVDADFTESSELSDKWKTL